MPMLDATKVQQIVSEYLPIYTRMLGLESWRIEVQIRPIEQGTNEITLAEVNLMPERERAFIAFHPTAFSTEQEVQSTLLHELFHIVVAPMKILEDNIPSKLPANRRDDFHQLYNMANEMVVRSLERALGAMQRFNEVSNGEDERTAN